MLRLTLWPRWKGSVMAKRKKLSDAEWEALRQRHRELDRRAFELRESMFRTIEAIEGTNYVGTPEYDFVCDVTPRVNELQMAAYKAKMDLQG